MKCKTRKKKRSNNKNKRCRNYNSIKICKVTEKIMHRQLGKVNTRNYKKWLDTEMELNTQEEDKGFQKKIRYEDYAKTRKESERQMFEISKTKKKEKRRGRY